MRFGAKPEPAPLLALLPDPTRKDVVGHVGGDLTVGDPNKAPIKAPIR